MTFYKTSCMIHLFLKKDLIQTCSTTMRSNDKNVTLPLSNVQSQDGDSVCIKTWIEAVTQCTIKYRKNISSLHRRGRCETFTSCR